MERGDRAYCRQLGGLAAASLAKRIQEERWKQQRPFPASKSRWKLSTLDTCYHGSCGECECE
eukprot:2511123-Prymnesium_polylepis.1